MTEKLTRYFTQIAYLTRDRKLTAQDVRDAAAATGDIADISEAVLAHAEACGIHPEKELSDLYNARNAAQSAAKERERRAVIKTVLAEIEKQTAALAADIDTAPLDQITDALSGISFAVAKLTSAAAAENRFPSWDDYEAAWQKETDRDFSPLLFNRLTFPDGTVSYIGARTGRGKTTALINLGIEALFAESRRVLFISLEESQKQILRRFSLGLAYRDNKKMRTALLSVTNPHTGKQDPKNAYKNWKRGRDIGGEGAKDFITAITKADEQMKKKVEEKGLVFFDGIGASLYEILGAIRERRRGDIILLDYIQKIPGQEKTYSGNPDLERIRQGSQLLIEAAQSASCVVIAGAQFNREGAKGKGDDAFTDADFRGCGDLEQDGHNLVGIGRSGDKQKTYFGIIKSREGESSDFLSTLDFAGGYSFMTYAGDAFAPNSRKGTIKKTTTIYNSDGSSYEADMTGEPEPL